MSRIARVWFCQEHLSVADEAGVPFCQAAGLMSIATDLVSLYPDLVKLPVKSHAFASCHIREVEVRELALDPDDDIADKAYDHHFEGWV